MEGKTYLELLAENDEEARRDFEPNAKDLLTAGFVEYEEEVPGEDHHTDELEDQEAFKKPQGSYQEASVATPVKPGNIALKSDVHYEKEVQVHVISIDSRFRTNLTENPSDFLFKLLTPIKNVISVRLSSIELPNTWYTFSDIRGNVSIIITLLNGAIGRVVITQGNYSVGTLGANDILIELFNRLNVCFPRNSFGVTFSAISGILTIACYTKNNAPVGGYTYINQPTAATETPVSFSMNFADGIFSNRESNWGLGYNLGYRVKKTEFATSHLADEIVDVIDSPYVFVSLNPDWRIVEHSTPDKTNTSAFAKIIIDQEKNAIVYNNSNTLTKTYFLQQPTNIKCFKVELFDEFEQIIQLMGGNISMTLEVTEVLHSSLYESMRL